MLRLATAAVLAPLLWVMIKVAPAWAFSVATGAVILRASWECFRMLEERGDRPFKLLGLAAVAGITWSFAGGRPSFDSALPLLLLTLVTMLYAMWAREAPQEMLESTVSTVFPVVFLGLTLAYIVQLRGLPGNDGEDVVLLLFFCVIFADTGAYYVGSRLGKHPMAPRLSPKKSWEGVAGALAGSVGAAVVAHLWFYQRLPLSHALILGVLLGIAGILGDLAESVFKRATGVKDSSGLLPGHGGVFDRTDSLLFASPLLYFYYCGFLQGAS